MTLTIAEQLALRYAPETPAPLAVFGQWAVCTDGLYCLVQTYDIELAQLVHDFWPAHMAEKRWVNLSDFRAAYGYALAELLDRTPPPPCAIEDCPLPGAHERSLGGVATHVCHIHEADLAAIDARIEALVALGA